MAAEELSQPVDALAVRARVRTLHIGLWPSVFTAAFLATYVLWTWERPHRPALLALCALALVASLALRRLPIDGLVRGRLREPFFLAWSASLVALIALGAALDGGARSPVALLFFLPLAFAALSYPLVPMLVVGAGNLVAFLSLAVVGGELVTPYVFLLASSLVAAAWICAWQAANLDGQRRDLARVSRTDPLTGALNRRGFEERFAAELADAERHRRPAALVVLDLDAFKQVNDTEGHAAGDELLRWVVDALRRELRPRDAIGRLGGDEFALLLDADEHAARLGVTRLLARLAERAPVSAGLAVFPIDGISSSELLRIADARLYARKQDRPLRDVRRELSWAAALARTVDDRMAVTHEHSHAVAGHAAAIGEHLGWAGERLGLLRLAAMLHDVGKIRVPEEVLRKPGPLTEAEFALVAQHAEAGAEIVARVDGLSEVAEWIRHSHERVDGGGYPHGLRGEQIPLASRILLVADAFDAMTSDRAYRRALPPEAALAELRRHAGRHFDPSCVDALEAHRAAVRASRASA